MKEDLFAQCTAEDVFLARSLENEAGRTGARLLSRKAGMVSIVVPSILPIRSVY
ncbi:hypothetical protein D3C75_1168020 [compost metagenome]